ncbi:MAG: hypothetical protein IJX28_05695 [Clostridia bacterium]|nr:hypothetical protein [Clostridia bacterium]
MNRSVERNDYTHSDNGIFEAFFTESQSYKTGLQKGVDALLSFLFVLRRILCGQAVRKWSKVVSLSLCLVGFVGVIGAMERGTLGLGMGMLIGAGLLLVEYFCLRSKSTNTKENE